MNVDRSVATDLLQKLNLMQRKRRKVIIQMQMISLSMLMADHQLRKNEKESLYFPMQLSKKLRTSSVLISIMMSFLNTIKMNMTRRKKKKRTSMKKMKKGREGRDSSIDCSRTCCANSNLRDTYYFRFPKKCSKRFIH